MTADGYFKTSAMVQSMATRAHFSVALTLQYGPTCPNLRRTVNGALKDAPIGARPRGAAVARRILTSTGAASPGCLPLTRSAWASDRCRPRSSDSSAAKRRHRL